MKVAIDSGPLSSGHSVRGIGVHTRELTNELKNLNTEGLTIDIVDFTVTDLAEYDLAHFTSFKPYSWTIPLSKVCPKMVLTIHDTIPLIYPKAYPPGIKGRLRFEVQKLALRNFDAIITISETSKKGIVRFLPIFADKIQVIYLAPKGIFRKSDDTTALRSAVVRYNLPNKFVLYVNDINYNKNIMVLADSCKKLKLPLVIVGKQAASDNVDFTNIENYAFKQFLDRYGKDKQFMRLGFVPDDDLVCLYNLASVFCMPSLYEGFGLQTLEAMASGCPVVASKTQALVEINGDAVLYADPKSPESFADAITNILSDNKLRDNLIQKGFKKASDYSWGKTAKETLKVYEKVVSSR